MVRGIFNVLTNKRYWNYAFIRDRVETRLPLLRRLNPFWEIERAIRENQNFDTTSIDQMISRAIEPYSKFVRSPRSGSTATRIAYLVTSMADNAGGHNKLIVNGYKLLSEDYECKLFLTQKTETEASAPMILSEMDGYDGINARYHQHIRDVASLAQKIVDYNPKMLLVYGHPNDYWAIAVVALLKKVSKIKVMVSEHTSHYPCIGASLSDITFHAAMAFAYVDHHYRHNYKVLVSRATLLCGRVEWERLIPRDNKIVQRREMGIPDDCLLTVSSGAGYKFFNADGSSDYFAMITNMLRANPKVVHVIRAWGNKVQMVALRDAIRESGCEDRLRLLPPTREYERFYAAADLLIDSVPVASALTMIELMRLKVPYVVFANRENTLWTFDEYQRDDYPFIYETTTAMLEGVNALLRDERLRTSELEKNYEYYIKTYEGNASKAFLKNVIEHVDNLESLYSPPPREKYPFQLDDNGNPCAQVLGGVM